MVSSGLKQAAMSLGLAVAVICCYAAVALAEDAASSAPAAAATASAKPAVAATESLVPPAPVIPALGLPVEKVSAELQNNFASMVHYYKIARFDLATNFAQAVLGGSPDAAMMVAMVETPEAGYSLLAEMAASDNAELADAAKKIKKLAEEGIYAKRKDGQRIMAALESLTKNQAMFRQGMMELRYSGEYVAPYALAILSDNTRPAALNAATRDALVALDKPVVYPLVLSLATTDENLKLQVIGLLQKMNYKLAVPALKALIENPASSDRVKKAATAAVLAIGGKADLDTAARKLYYDQADQFYYGKLTVVGDPSRPETDVWGWVPGQGLAYRPAPTSVVNDICGARACELGLAAEPNALELVALWTSTEMDMNAKFEQVSAGGLKNPWAPATMPTTAFFGRAIGQQYLLDVLDRALGDNNVPVARQAIRALQEVANETFLAAGIGKKGSPLVAALEYPDRLVRFDAAFAIVAVEPHKSFGGADRVVPVLAEALNLQTGAAVLLIDGNADNRNRLKGEFRQAHWAVTDASSGNDGVSKARGMARIDAIVLATNVDKVDYVETLQLLRSDFATAMVPVVFLSGAEERVKFSYLKENQKYIDEVPAGATALAIIDKVKVLSAAAGAVALEPKASREIALRAARTLGFVATANLSVTALPARAALLTAIGGKDQDLVIASLAALAQMPDEEIEQRIAETALAAGAPKAVQIAALNAVAQSARHIGNKLQSATVTALMKRISTETDNDIRDAVGTVIGALDLEAKLSSELIRDHAVEHEGTKAAK
jgi:CheY-like chemotaxis protein